MNLPSDDAVRQTWRAIAILQPPYAATRAAIRAYLTQTDEGRALVRKAGEREALLMHVTRLSNAGEAFAWGAISNSTAAAWENEARLYAKQLNAAIARQEGEGNG